MLVFHHCNPINSFFNVASIPSNSEQLCLNSTAKASHPDYGDVIAARAAALRRLNAIEGRDVEAYIQLVREDNTARGRSPSKHSKKNYDLHNNEVPSMSVSSGAGRLSISRSTLADAELMFAESQARLKEKLMETDI